MPKRGNDVPPRSGEIAVGRDDEKLRRPLGPEKTIEVDPDIPATELAAPDREKINPINFLIELLYAYGLASIDFIANQSRRQLGLDRYEILNLARTSGKGLLVITKLSNDEIGLDLTPRGYLRGRQLEQKNNPPI